MKRALRFSYSDNTSPYETVLGKARKVTMNINRLRAFCIEIYEAVNKITPSFMYEMFKFKDNNRLVQKMYKKLMVDVLRKNALWFSILP